jgi:VWFA-related protein
VSGNYGGEPLKFDIVETVARSFASVVVCLLLFTWCALPQQPRQKPGEAEPGLVIRTETNLVLVPFHVVHKGKYVEDLGVEDIQLLEDGVAKRIALFEGPQGGSARRTTPVEIILLLDVSLSVMNWNLLDSLSLKDTLLDGLGDHVTISIYAFAGRLKRFTRPTRDVEKLKAALGAAYGYAHGGTRLYEAIMQTARDAASSGTNATRLMLVLSDGLSTTKRRPDDAVQVANVFGIPLYPVVLGHDRVVKQANRGETQLGGGPPLRGGTWGNRPPPGAAQRGRLPGGMPAEQRREEREARARDLELRMAEFAATGTETGGRSFDPKIVNNAMIREIFESLVKQINAEYVVGYYPPSPGDNRRAHQIQVTLRDKNRGKIYGGSRMAVY